MSVTLQIQGAKDKIERRESKNVVSLNFTSWNQLEGWLRQADRVRRAA